MAVGAADGLVGGGAWRVVDGVVVARTIVSTEAMPGPPEYQRPQAIHLETLKLNNLNVFMFICSLGFIFLLNCYFVFCF